VDEDFWAFEVGKAYRNAQSPALNSMDLFKAGDCHWAGKLGGTTDAVGPVRVTFFAQIPVYKKL